MLASGHVHVLWDVTLCNLSSSPTFRTNLLVPAALPPHGWTRQVAPKGWYPPTRSHVVTRHHEHHFSMSDRPLLLYLAKCLSSFHLTTYERPCMAKWMLHLWLMQYDNINSKGNDSLYTVLLTEWHSGTEHVSHFNVIPPLLHIHLHTHVALTRRTNGRSLNLLKGRLFR